MKRSIDLKEKDLKTALKIMMAESGIDSWSELAKKIEMNPNTFRSAINNEAIRLYDFMKASEAMGYTVIVQGENSGAEVLKHEKEKEVTVYE